MNIVHSFWRKLAVVAILLPLAACRDDANADPKTDPIRPVLYVVAAPEQMKQAGFAGTIEPRYSTELAFRVLGRVISRPVDIGDLVKQGDIVAMLDPAALDLGVQSAKADLASAEAQYANASASEERQRILLEGNNISQANYDQAKQARDSAQANLEKAQAGLRKTQDQRSYANLTSKYDGLVSSISAEVGQVVAAGQPIMTIARPDIREAVIDIPDSMTDYLKPGLPFSVRLQADPSVVGHGAIREVSPQADAQTRTRRVRIALDNPPEGFRLGATATAIMDVAENSRVVLPISALLEQDGKTAIWIIDPKTQIVSLKEVQIGERGSDSFVAGDVEIGAYVVIAGVNSLTEGQKVRLDTKGNAL